MLASDNYAWVFTEGTFYHVMRVATGRHRVVLCREYMIDDRSHTYLIKWLPPEVNVILRGRGTHHVIKCTRHSPSENTPTRNYNLWSMRAWRSLVSRLRTSDHRPDMAEGRGKRKVEYDGSLWPVKKPSSSSNVVYAKSLDDWNSVEEIQIGETRFPFFFNQRSVGGTPFAFHIQNMVWSPI